MYTPVTAVANHQKIRKIEMGEQDASDGLTNDGSSVLDRQTVHQRYSDAVKKALLAELAWEDDADLVELLAAVVGSTTHAVMNVRDRELQMLRQRLALADELVGVAASCGGAADARLNGPLPSPAPDNEH